MTPQTPAGENGGLRLRAEFDLLADEYYRQHEINVAITGEKPEYFAEYKIADLALLVQEKSLAAGQIFDFGSGIGNSVPFFRQYFGQSELHCGDISARSIEVAQARFPGGQEKYVLIGNAIPLPAQSQDIVFSACVFHHIPREDHQYWLAELRRVTRPGGLLVIYEHNPLNPLTVRAVNTCPLDINARLIRSGTMRKHVLAGGWEDTRVDYRIFYPSFFKSLRYLERYLGWLGLGAQYRLTARRPA
jgi:SAM-dependent methyltransferase